MIRILIPNNNISEREYSINTVCGVFLGLNYCIEIGSEPSYVFILENQNHLVIKDGFFSEFPERLSYLRLENIPKKPILLHDYKFTSENTLPVLFGNEQLTISENRIECGADIIASSFFMLTRWEEYVNQVRDKHNRFPGLESLAYKHGFLHRPIVNEYVEMLWNMLVFLGYKGQRKTRSFEFFATHDVDRLRLFESPYRFLKVFGGHLVKRRNVSAAYHHVKQYMGVLSGTASDPFDTFDWLMQISESHNIQSRFYFMAGGTSRYDPCYSLTCSACQSLIEKIKKRGHVIGFHPSYNAYRNPELFGSEKCKVESAINCPVFEGRHHYMRFEAPVTWQIWQDHDLKVDSTVYYPDKEGFRCGVCYEFPAFNFLSRKQLDLIERPLIVMEGSFLDYQAYLLGEMGEKIKQLMDKVKQYSGMFVLLWHNSSFHSVYHQQYTLIYKRLLEEKVGKGFKKSKEVQSGFLFT
ncbi:polysaccharide deacetylase family protein [Thermoproteota archaeon]